MKAWLLCLPVAALGAAISLSPSSNVELSNVELSGELEWRTDLDAARQEAKTTGKPMLVVFR